MALPQPASAEPETEADQPARDAQYYRRVLHELIDIGADLARQIQRQATAQTEAVTAAVPPADIPTLDPAIAFDRVARSIRRSIALARTLANPPPQAAQHPTAARKRILREVEDAIDRVSDDRLAELAEAEEADLRLELLERLDAPDTEDDISGRPVEDIISDIRRDLGIGDQSISHRGRHRTPAEPFTAMAPDRTPPVRDQVDETPEVMSLTEIILRHAAEANPGFPAHETSQSPRAGPR